MPAQTGKQLRQMSGAISHEEEVKQMNLWRNCTIAAIPLCIGVAIWDLSQAHEHGHDGPQGVPTRMRSKELDRHGRLISAGAQEKLKNRSPCKAEQKIGTGMRSRL
ncbi:g5548 [Coccomyxa viridis]|uniref:G5548 protein n=1 Tax=Coccomyxa viridis TaxID=1274662 RepID=A0ABP1FT49_9CHLO